MTNTSWSHSVAGPVLGATLTTGAVAVPISWLREWQNWQT